MTEGIFDEAGKVIGVKALDRITGDEFEIYAKNVIFAGGPFTDALRQKESESPHPVKPAVQGASGSHIVLPGYYAPHDMGLLDYNTSDGRFLFFLPWQGSVVVGTTDKKCSAETLPYPPEDEIQWMLKECEKYLSNDLKVRRSDVLSAWRGWRPLAADPHAPPGAQVSRDHVISKNPESGVTFIAGGKWTTWREMAEDVLDKTLGEEHGTCHTLDLVLHGGEGYSENLDIQIIQRYGLTPEVAEVSYVDLRSDASCSNQDPLTMTVFIASRQNLWRACLGGSREVQANWQAVAKVRRAFGRTLPLPRSRGPLCLPRVCLHD